MTGNSEKPPVGWETNQITPTPPWFPTIWPFGGNYLVVAGGVSKTGVSVHGVLQVRPVPDVIRALPPEHQPAPDELWEHLRKDLTLSLCFDNSEAVRGLIYDLQILEDALREEEENFKPDDA